MEIIDTRSNKIRLSNLKAGDEFIYSGQRYILTQHKSAADCLSPGGVYGVKLPSFELVYFCDLMGLSFIMVEPAVKQKEALCAAKDIQPGEAFRFDERIFVRLLTGSNLLNQVPHDFLALDVDKNSITVFSRGEGANITVVRLGPTNINIL